MISEYIKNSVPFVKTGDLYKAVNESEEFIILDTREPEEYEISHLKNAINTGYNSFNIKSLTNIPKDSKIVLYCSIGHRSERIGEILIQEGYTRVYNLYGGIFEWINQQYPLIGTDGKITSKIHPYNEEWGKWIRNGIKTYE